MSIDVAALEANFSNWKAERAPASSMAYAFEYYSIEQILKDWDPSDDDIQQGMTGGGDDGGVDGLYFFVNRKLMAQDSPLPSPVTSVDLVIIQAKCSRGFQETVIQKLESFTRDLLDFNRPIAEMTYLNSDVRDFITLFREQYGRIIGTPHKLTVQFHYATKADSEPGRNDKIRIRAETLMALVREKISYASVSVTYWSAARLLDRARADTRTTGTLTVERYFSTADRSVVCLASLGSFAEFITTEKGELRTSILEPNVRDYQGKQNPVNKAIRETLMESGPTEEFWWLNNGITILAEDCSIAGTKVIVTEPEIVNGLQTSHEVHMAFTNSSSRDDQRHILVRVIIPQNETGSCEAIRP